MIFISKMKWKQNLAVAENGEKMKYKYLAKVLGYILPQITEARMNSFT